MKAKDIAGENEQPILAQYDKANRVLVDGSSLLTLSRVIREPSFRLDGVYPGFGDLLLAQSARWLDANAQHPSGYLLDGVQRPDVIDELPSVGVGERLILMTSRDQPWLGPRQCFFATTVRHRFPSNQPIGNADGIGGRAGGSDSQSRRAQQHGAASIAARTDPSSTVGLSF